MTYGQQVESLSQVFGFQGQDCRYKTVATKICQYYAWASIYPMHWVIIAISVMQIIMNLKVTFLVQGRDYRYKTVATEICHYYAWGSILYTESKIAISVIQRIMNLKVTILVK